MVLGGSGSLYLIFFLFIAFTYSGHSHIRFRYGSPSFISTIYPGGNWNYYTMAPEKERIYRVYSIEGNKPVLVDLRPFCAKYCFGLNRDSKTLAVETEMLAIDTGSGGHMVKYEIKIPQNETDISKYINTDTLSYNTVSSAHHTLLRGRVILTTENFCTWKQHRNKSSATKTVTVIPISINQHP